jgi:uncharacterized protein
MAVTFDTNVLLSATLWDGSVAQKLLYDLIKQNVTIYSSLAIVSDYEKILRRDFYFSDEEIADLLEKVISFVTIIHPKKKVTFIERDPDDDTIIECAVAAGAKYIITYDKDLLVKKEYENIRIIRPEEARAIF